MNDRTKGYYDSHAEEYADNTRSVDISSLWSLLTSRVDEGASILDLGCGAGRDLRYFSEAGYHVTGMDYSQSLVAIARQESGQEVLCGDFRKLPFASASFDAVWAVASLLHLPRSELGSTIREIGRVLRLSGVFIASMKIGTREYTDEHGRLFTEYRPAEWERVLVTNGFQQVAMETTTEHRHRNGTNEMVIEWFAPVAIRQPLSNEMTE